MTTITDTQRTDEWHAALRWALEQIDDDLDPDHQDALVDAWDLLEGIE
jgi:hypothetical protein